jgi:small multidrug resistance pump
MNWVYLCIASVAEVVATSALKTADGFTRVAPSMVVIIGYVAVFYFLSLALRTIPVGIAYAIWSGIGIALIAFIGWWLYGQRLDIAAIVGVALIIVGVAVLNGFSKAVTH